MNRYILHLIALIMVGFLAAGDLFAEVEAEVETEKGYKKLVLKEIEDGSLVYRPPDVERGVEASLALEEIRSVRFELDYDSTEVFKNEQERQWVKAARGILESTMPTLPFLALPENNAVEPAFRAGQLLERAAHAYERRGDEGDATRAQKLYKQARQVLNAVGRAEWNYLSEPAGLKAVGCKVALGDIDSAEKELKKKREPDPYDGAYGQYWLTKARLLFAQGEVRPACNAVAKTVVFDNKNSMIFSDALLFFGRCHEEMTDFHRARDIYYEVARLFTNTEWGKIAVQRLEYIMDNDLTAEKEKSNIAKVFFGIDEDMNEKSNELLKKIEERKEEKKYKE